MRWKLLGLAGFAGVAATGVAVARTRRAQTELSPEEVRARLHERLAQVKPAGDASPPDAATGGGAAPPAAGA